MTISIHSVTTIAECQAIERLQLEIWDSGDLEVTPGHLLITIAKEGGVVLLAQDETAKPIGFAFGFLGRDENDGLKLASHQAGVLPAYQDKGVGYQLKLAQREIALTRNLDRITWTFDPLQGRNARLNLGKLGAVCRTYFRNLYGDMQDGLNQGLPSDRFRVDWWIATEHVRRHLAGQISTPTLSSSVCPILNPATHQEDGLLVPAATFVLPSSPFCLVEIPVDLSALKTAAPHVALQWRLQTRDIFEAVFALGYSAIDLLRQEGRNYYLLQKDWQPA